MIKKDNWPIRFLQGIIPEDKSQIGPDILAGLTLAALGIPEVMGYTKIIEMPVVTGLYTLLVPMIIFCIFGSSRHLVVGADSATAAIVAATLVVHAIPYSDRYVQLAGLVALLAGGMLLLARIFRAGFIADFMSRTVLVGFLTGVGLQVAFGELPHVLGIPKGGSHFFGQMVYTFKHLSLTQSSSLFISATVIAIIAGFDKFSPRFPGALLAVVGMIIASTSLHWEDKGISLIGTVPGGLPKLAFPVFSWNDVLEVLPTAFSCFVVIIAQSAATSRAYAVRYRDQFSENEDLVGLGLANLAASFSSTFVVNGSPTKTAMVDTAGGKSQLSQFSTAMMVLLVLLFLTKPLSYLPNAVLASIVLMIGIKLIDTRGMLQIYRVKPKEFLLALITTITVVAVGVEQGILLALVLSLFQQVGRSYMPHTEIIVHDPVEKWRTERVETNQMIEPGMVMYWFGAELFYANANHFTQEIHQVVQKADAKLEWLVVDSGAITSIDYSAGQTLKELHQDLNARGIVLAFTRVASDLRADFDRMNLTALIGSQYLFFSRAACIKAFHERKRK